VVGVALVPSAPAAEKLTMAHFSLGPSLPQGDMKEFLDQGWAAHGGYSWFSPSNPALGLRLDFGVDWWEMDDSLLDTIDTDPSTPITIEPPDDGDAWDWSGSVDLVWNPRTGGVVGFYALVGVSADYIQWNLAQDGYGYSYWCDWWWGVCYPTLVSGQYQIESGDDFVWGYQAGIGVTFGTASGEFYLEAIYRWLETENGAEFVPVQAGYRW
jgi:hypothetical protein